MPLRTSGGRCPSDNYERRQILTRKWVKKGMAIGLGLATMGVAGVAAAREAPLTPGAAGRTGADERAQGVGHGFHAGTVKITTRKKADGKYELVDPSRGNTTVINNNSLGFSGRFVGSVPVDADNDWGNGKATDIATGDVDAFYAAEQTWDYLADVHGRRGVAGDGAGPRLLTNVGDGKSDGGGDGRTGSYESSCRCVVLSPAPPGGKTLAAQDVIAHEIAHELSGLTAGLGSDVEARALDESSSDIIGTLVEFHANNPHDPPDYTIGEGAWDKPIRYMDDPTKDGKSAGCWKPGISSGKDTDSHLIGGISNKFFYQLAVGSGKSRWGNSPTCGGAPAVVGIGNEKAGKIWYRALTLYMVANTNFSGARQATLRAATDLYGKDGMEVKTVKAAWNAVGVDGKDKIPTAPVKPKFKFFGFFDVTGTVGKAFELYLQAPDPQRQRVTFTATGLPPGLSIDARKGVISGTPTKPGNYQPRITATDTDGNNDTMTEWTWTIEAA